MNKMKKQKGFTLIELLAIIVILAIIAVITVPIILNVIDNAKKGTAKDSAYGYKDAISKYYVSGMLEDESIKLNDTYNVTDGKLGGYDIPFSGTKPTSGYLTFENNILTTGCLTIDEYKIVFDKGEVVSTDVGECDEFIKKDKLAVKKYTSGESVTYGGYDWHVVGDDGEHVTLLMDAGENGNYKMPLDEYNDLNEGIMHHCIQDENGNKIHHCENGYSIEQSGITKYLNDIFYNDLIDKIDNEIIGNDICNDSQESNQGYSYGGYLKSEINLVQTSCTTTYTNLKVRLLTISEFYNMSSTYTFELPYTGKISSLPETIETGTANNGTIPKIDWISKINGDLSWLEEKGKFWTYNVPSIYMAPSYLVYTIVPKGGSFNFASGSNSHSAHVRPVITVKK